MAKYFNYFPQTVYTLQDNATSVDLVTNITSKFGFEQKFKENTSLYYEYVVTDGETPEILAHKIYGDSEKHWIILAMNDIFSPTTDWPVEQRSLINIIDTKYTGAPYANTANGQTGLEWSQQNYHSYYKIETQTNLLTGEASVHTMQVDSNTYTDLAVSSTTNYTLADNNTISITVERDAKTYYDYEIDMNEQKRKIKILSPQFVPSVDEEFRNVFK